MAHSALGCCSKFLYLTAATGSRYHILTPLQLIIGPRFPRCLMKKRRQLLTRGPVFRASTTVETAHALWLSRLLGSLRKGLKVNSWSGTVYHCWTCANTGYTYIVSHAYLPRNDDCVAMKRDGLLFKVRVERRREGHCEQPFRY